MSSRSSQKSTLFVDRLAAMNPRSDSPVVNSLDAHSEHYSGLAFVAFPPAGISSDSSMSWPASFLARLGCAAIIAAALTCAASTARAACDQNDPGCAAKEAQVPSSFGGAPDWAVPSQGGPKRQPRGGAMPQFQGAHPETAVRPAPRNTESSRMQPSFVDAACAPGKASARAASFSFDGKPIDGSAPTVGDSQICTDRTLKKADIQVRYDGFSNEPSLNVMAVPNARNAGSNVRFETYSNYATSLARGEIRIFENRETVKGAPVATVPLTGTSAEWQVPRAGKTTEYVYVMRVYDSAGRFDETAPKILDVSDSKGSTNPAVDRALLADNNTRLVKNIPISGGTILVSGRNIRPDEKVTVMGQPAQIDSSGSFAFRQILPSGDHDVDIAISEPSGPTTVFSRSANIPQHDFFYVGLAEMTVGRNVSKGPVGLLNPEQADNFKGRYFVDGRFAVYLKGKVKGETLITASADTRDQPFNKLFTNFHSKDPTYLLRNLDPNRYYPVYGDDSTLVEDAPTRGKFYIRVENGDNNIMWGNFKTEITGTDFVRYDRGLYGARVQLKTPESTRFGERRGKLEGFAAEPGTLGVRDVFLGTGGSSYFLSHQNITMGSERVVVEVRDRISGVVMQTKYLSAGTDYTVNYIQGRINLNAPLSSVGSSDFIVQAPGLNGVYQYVVVNYEYAAGLTPVRDRVVGGRASYWLSDYFQVGVTGYDQSGSVEKLRIGGADVTARLSPLTYIKAEIARSSGNGSSENVSIDGGFSFNTRRSLGGAAWAKRIEGAVELGEIITGAQGRIVGFYKDKQANYSGPGEITTFDTGATKDFGGRADVRFSDHWSARARFDGHTDRYRNYYAGEANISYAFNEVWKVTVGVRADQNNVQRQTASRELNRNGERIDTALRIDYTPSRDWGLYAFGQVTALRTGERNRNNRVGAGGYMRLSDRLVASAEISGGDGGLGGKLGAEYKSSDDRTVYVNYAMDPDRTDILDRGGLGLLAVGSRYRFADDATVFAETRRRHGGGFSGLMHAYGVEFSPFKDWKIGARGEVGKLSDPLNGDVRRLAVSPHIAYSANGVSYSSRFEYRHDKGFAAQPFGVIASQTRDTYLMANSLTMKINPNWRLLTKLNGSYSNSTQGDFYRGNYLEGVVGFAYRPIYNDRLNMLFKYTYFYNVPSPGQVAIVKGLNDYVQKSHIVSADAIYDINQWFSIGGKIGYRGGSIKDNVLGTPWHSSHVLLAVGRVDFHVVKQWDVTAEIRNLSILNGGNSQTGALLAIYRQVNDNFKIGAGYNFTRFSDDLTNLSMRNRGFFLNALGMF